MKNYYGNVAPYASKADKQALSLGIDPSQRGNESKFSDDIRQYPVSLKHVNKTADRIAAHLFPSK